MDRSTPTSGPPDGVVTFLLTDVVSSTRLWRDSADAAEAVASHAELIAGAARDQLGVRPPDQGEGDSTLWVFDRPGAALAAALAAQQALITETWPEGATIEVRMAVHSGEAERLVGGNYGGLSLIRCARLRDLAHGGQVLTTAATAELAAEALPAGASLGEIGLVPLPGLDRPERVFSLRHPDLVAPSSRVGRLRASATQGVSAWPTDLIGRGGERKAVADLIAQSRLVTITGVGGSGKTRLAHAIAEDLGDRLPDGVAWVELARVAEGSQVAPAVLNACGGIESPGLPVLELLCRTLVRAEILLVIDNCEHVLDACAELADALLRAAPEVRMLTTAREPLGVAGESSWRIPSLSLPREGETDPDKILESESVTLFVERARSARADFSTDGDTAIDVAKICRRLDGIPLAIELAAARVRALSVAHLLTGLDDRFRLLTGGPRTALSRQRTLLASVEWSHDLLDEEERLLFRRLAVFASPFLLEASEAVAADENTLDHLAVFDILARLVDKSLVIHAANDRYRMLETLRQYALERADEAGELVDLRDRHLAWFTSRGETWDFDHRGETDAELDEIEALRPDLLSALEWSQAPGRSLATPILCALARYWFVRQDGEELRTTAARILDRLDEGGPEWLEALAPMSAALFFAGELGWMAAAVEGLAQHEDALTSVARAHLESSIGTPLASYGIAEGVERWRKAVDINRISGNRALEVSQTVGFSIMLAQVGRLKEAAPLVAWAERNLPSETSLEWGVKLPRSWIALFTGDFETALSLLSDLGTWNRGAWAWQALAALWLDDRRLEAEALANMRAVPDPGIFAASEPMVLAVERILNGEYRVALDILRTVDANAQLGTTVLWPRLAEAEASLAIGDHDGSERTCAALAERFEGCELPLFQGWLADVRAQLCRARGEATEAHALAHAALEITTTHGLSIYQSEALGTLAVLAAEADRPDEAARLLGASEAFRVPRQIRFRWPHRHATIEKIRPDLNLSHLEEGARMSLDEAAEYARRGRGERGRPDTGWDALTPTELRVAELVAEGRSNKEVSAELFVSVATVKTHLVHVFAKLGVKRRGELAAQWARRPM